MKQYAFYSDLTPEQLRSRLVARTRPMKMGWMYEEHRVFARLLPDGGFYLQRPAGSGNSGPCCRLRRLCRRREPAAASRAASGLPER